MFDGLSFSDSNDLFSFSHRTAHILNHTRDKYAVRDIVAAILLDCKT